MNKKLMIILLAFAFLLVGATALYNVLGESFDMGSISGEQEYVPQPAPDFTVYDAEGNAAHLSDYVGKPIVLNFWTSWCGPCQMEMPHFQKKYEELGDEVQFLMVNITNSGRESEEAARQFIADSGYTFPVLYDLDSEAMYTYGVTSFPTSYFIDAEGLLAAGFMGAMTADMLQQGIDIISE